MNLGQYVGLTPTRYPILQNATIQSIANISISCKEGRIVYELASSEGWLAMKFVGAGVAFFIFSCPGNTIVFGSVSGLPILRYNVPDLMSYGKLLIVSTKFGYSLLER